MYAEDLERWSRAPSKKYVRRLVDEEIRNAIHEERAVKAHLKIKIKSLAAEAVIIRQEERKWTKTVSYEAKNGRVKQKVIKNHPLRLSLQAHRKGAVRGEARRSLLAYAYMRGRPLKAVDKGLVGDRYILRPGNELVSRSRFPWSKIEDMVVRFGGDPEGFAAWTQAQ